MHSSDTIPHGSDGPNFLGVFALISATISLLAWQSRFARSILKFAWNCFLKPVRGKSQLERLNSFYAGQADVYDDTRGGLLKGRENMLRLVAAHVKTQEKVRRHTRKESPKIWIDIGGGTGKLILLTSWGFRTRAHSCLLRLEYRSYGRPSPSVVFRRYLPDRPL
jgi:hypothetical protein